MHTTVLQGKIRRGNRATRCMVIVAALVVMSACTKNYRTAVTGFREAPVCCTSLAEIPVEPLKMGSSTHFALDEGTPAYRFDTGKSYFRAFRLPDGPYPYRVTVDSYLVGGYLKSAYLFRPVVMTLDADRRPVRIIDGGDFTVERAGIVEAMWQAGGLKQKLTGGVDFSEANRNERYLVVLTTDTLLKGTTAVPVGGESTMLLLSSGGGTMRTEEVQVPNAPTGRLGIAAARIEAAAQAHVATAPGPSPTPARTVTPAPAPVGTTVSVPAGPSVDLVARPETVRLHRTDGTVAGTLELGRSDIAAARNLLVPGGGTAGEAQPVTTSYLVGPTTLAPTKMLATATSHQLYFDAAGRLVLVVDRAPAGIPATIEAFRSRFPSSWETGRTLASVEFQTLLSPCVALVAVYRTADGGLDLAAYGYSCEPY